MGRLVGFCSLSLSIAVLFGCATTERSSAPAVDTEAITASVDSVNQAYLAAVAARDTDAVVVLYAEDASAMPANAPRADGHDAIRRMWVEVLRTPDLDFNFTSTGKTVSQAGDIVIDLGTYNVKGKAPNGSSFNDTGKYVTILKKTDAGWKVFVDTFNSDQPMPGM